MDLRSEPARSVELDGSPSSRPPRGRCRDATRARSPPRPPKFARLSGANFGPPPGSAFHPFGSGRVLRHVASGITCGRWAPPKGARGAWSRLVPRVYTCGRPAAQSVGPVSAWAGRCRLTAAVCVGERAPGSLRTGRSRSPALGAAALRVRDLGDGEPRRHAGEESRLSEQVEATARPRRGAAARGRCGAAGLVPVAASWRFLVIAGAVAAVVYALVHLRASA
jgi:hypothetical protein